MSWQLWVLVAAAVAGLVVLIAVKFHHAQQVFNRITVRPDDPTYGTERDQLATQRHKHARPTFIADPAHSHHHRSRRR